MATIRVLRDTRYISKDGTAPVVVSIGHKGGIRNIPTGWKVSEKYFSNGRITSKHPDATIINHRIDELEGEVKKYLAECQRTGRPVNLKRIGAATEAHTINDYLTHRAAQYEKKEMFIVARKTKRYQLDLLECFGGKIFFSDINQDKLRDFEAWLMKKGNDRNTIHGKFKRLQEFFSHAILDGKVEGPNPFKLYKIKKVPVRKEKLTADELKAIESVQLVPGDINDARNLFLFSYYCKGNRFETCITFRRENISNGRLQFQMNKGGKFISVKIHPRLQAIIGQYPEGIYLFPYIKSELPTDVKAYQKAIDSLNTIVNRNLKLVAAFAGITKKVTFHIARHTLAFHLKKVTDSIHVIKDTLGHSDTRTTEIYLQALDDETLDKEMEKVYGG